MLKKILLACRIIKYYCQGFVAAMCVIQMGDVPAHRESKSNGRHFLNTPLRYLMLPAYLYKNMIRFTPHKIQRNPALIAYCGHSKNNINQFENFHKWNESVLSEYDRPAYDNNIANAEVGFGMVRFRHVVVPNIVFAVLTFFLFLFTRIKLNKTTFEYGIKYYRSFIRHLFYCFENIDFLPQMVVFSNDHNPFYLGVSRCFKVFGVNRVYLQHGGVSNIFPKLDFEAAVLFDQKSKDIYSKLGPLPSLTWMVAREPTITGVSSPGDVGKKRIVIFPTGAPNVGKIKKRVSQLASNPWVDKIFIKWHPAFNSSEILMENVLKIDDINVLRKDDICVVGNSSVAVELAKFVDGPVFQDFNLDDIVRDYYGFVQDRLTLDVTEANFESEFWKYSPDALAGKEAALMKYCPIRTGDHEGHLREMNNWVNEIINNQCRKNTAFLENFKRKIKQRYAGEVEAVRFLIDSNSSYKSLIDQQVLSYDEFLALNTSKESL